MYEICDICKRPYAGTNCLRCTQASMFLSSFGAETIGQTPKTASHIESKTVLGDGMAKLKLPDGQLFGVSKPTCRIGQDSTNDIVITEDDGTERFHAQISLDAVKNEYVLRDLGTKEGTFLNGAQVHQDQIIFDGDQIKIGKQKFYFLSDLDE